MSVPSARNFVGDPYVNWAFTDFIAVLVKVPERYVTVTLFLGNETQRRLASGDHVQEDVNAHYHIAIPPDAAPFLLDGTHVKLALVGVAPEDATQLLSTSLIRRARAGVYTPIVLRITEPTVEHFDVASNISAQRVGRAYLGEAQDAAEDSLSLAIMGPAILSGFVLLCCSVFCVYLLRRCRRKMKDLRTGQIAHESLVGDTQANFSALRVCSSADDPCVDHLAADLGRHEFIAPPKKEHCNDASPTCHYFVGGDHSRSPSHDESPYVLEDEMWLTPERFGVGSGPVDEPGVPDIATQLNLRDALAAQATNTISLTLPDNQAPPDNNQV